MKPVKVYICWTRGKAFVSWLIRKLDGGRFNHVLLRFVFADGGPLIYESHIGTGVAISPSEQLMEAYLSGKVEDFCEKLITDNQDEAKEIWDRCRKMHGKKYDVLRIITYYLWIKLTHRKNKKVLKIHDPNRYTCNEFVIEGANIGGNDFSLTIEPLFKYFWGHPSKGDDE